MSLSDVALALASADVGQHEVGGNNRGPYVEACLARVHLPPGEPWCAAALVTWFLRASLQLGVPCPVPVTGSCLRLWELSEPYQDSNPSVGAVYILKHGEWSGHCGIIEACGSGGVTEISGNTNRDGSREGDSVWRHSGSSPEIIHGGELLGYLVFDRVSAALENS